jgi:elongation factor G
MCLGSLSSTKWIGYATTPLRDRSFLIGSINRPGANPERVIQQIRQKLRIAAAAVQVAIGAEDNFRGVVDLVRWKAIYNGGVKGCVLERALAIVPNRSHRNEVTEEEVIPPEVLETAIAKRAELIEQLAEVDEQMSDLFLEDAEITTGHMVSAIRRATIARKFTPVFLGSAVKNTAVQPLLDGVCAYLPNTADVTATALDLSKPSGEQQVSLVPAVSASLVALAFKLEEGRYGQLTYMRVYQGSFKKGGWIYHTRTAKRIKVPRLVRMHSDEMEVLPKPSRWF